MASLDEQRITPEAVIDALVAQEARVAGDVVEVGPHTWAIHGVIPVDGDVILAEFGGPDEARALLDCLPPNRSTG